MKQDVNVIKRGSETELAEMVSRIIAGDPCAEEEMIRRYEDGISITIGQIAQSYDATKDISQETFKIALEKIRNGDVREPERLSGFICGIARNLALEHVRKVRQRANREDVGKAEWVIDPAPSQLDYLCQKERAQIVHQVIDKLKVQRDREIIFRYCIAEEDKDHICADLGLTRAQFNNVISRALQRYKELYIKIIGEP
jgi:DNA-directed RNA polymerase specialized sigma subunit, sigma24 homolog